MYTTTLTESLSPRGKLLLLRKYSENSLSHSPALSEKMYACTLCGRCEEACPSHTEIPVLIQSWREHNPYNETVLNPLVESIQKQGNPYNREQWERETWHISHDEDAGTVYFPGCTTSLFQPGVATSFMKIMEDRIPLFIMDDRCCGSILAKTGFREESERVIQDTVDFLSERGIKTVITSCAGCYSFFLEYPWNVTVLHTSQVLTRFLDELNPHPLQTTYHDPCHLIKTTVTSQPRQIVKTLSEYTEKSDQRCCGAGGGLLLNFRELADAICRSLLAQSSFQTMVTACPFCLYHMKRNTLRKILSLEELAASCLTE
ncbi:MAG: (Fe-S)-binding protein [Theionarchaea archaeon]|nr:(Fe-S)-binding protein [Theionarchaea archaeon]